MATAVVVAFSTFSGHAEPASSDIESADRLFEAGKFAEAADIYKQVLAQTPNDDAAILQLARIALLANKLEDAQDWLQHSLGLDPGDTTARVLLAETLYRRDEFEKAANALSGVDVAPTS
jgi:predicted Zn-dependent protease